MNRSIVIIFDRLPAHWLGCYGNFDVETPVFDWLATQSVVFDRHYTNAPGSTVESALITGEYGSHAPAPKVTSPDQISDVLNDKNPEHPHTRWIWLPATIPVIPEGDAGDSDEPPEHEVEQCDEMLVDVLEQIDMAGWSDALLIVTGRRGELASTEESGGGVGSDQWQSTETANLLLGLLVRHPNVGGFRSKAITQPIDIPLTVANWTAGQNMPPDNCEGVLPLILGDTDRIHDYGYFSDKIREGIVADDFLLIRPRDNSTEAQLFLQPDDRWLIHNVAVEYPEVVDKLTGRLNERDQSDSR